MCDSLVALPVATDGRTMLFAKNSDRPPDEVQVVENLTEARSTGPVRCTWIDVEPPRAVSLACVVSRPSWCWGVEHGVNEAGVAAGNEAIYTTLDPRSVPVGLTGLDLVRLALQWADSAEAAVGLITDAIERYGQGGSGHDPSGRTGPKAYFSSFLVADAGAAWVIETSGRTWVAERVDDARAISNRTTIPAFDAEHRHPRQPVERFVDARWAASKAVLARRPVTVSSLLEHLASHDSCAEAGWSVCMHTPDEVTTASMLAEVRVGSAPVVHLAQGSPCTTAYRTISVDPATWSARTGAD
jgi:Peptidase family C69